MILWLHEENRFVLRLLTRLQQEQIQRRCIARKKHRTSWYKNDLDVWICVGVDNTVLERSEPGHNRRSSFNASFDRPRNISKINRKMSSTLCIAMFFSYNCGCFVFRLLCWTRTSVTTWLDRQQLEALAIFIHAEHQLRLSIHQSAATQQEVSSSMCLHTYP